MVSRPSPRPPDHRNIAALLSDIACPKPLWLLNFRLAPRRFVRMKQILTLTLLTLLALPSMAAAECYVTYKAKRQPPLELHLGILKLSGGCSGQIDTKTAKRIAKEDWTLLNVVRTSDTPPSASEQANAGQFYLRY